MSFNLLLQEKSLWSSGISGGSMTKEQKWKVSPTVLLLKLIFLLQCLFLGCQLLPQKALDHFHLLMSPSNMMDVIVRIMIFPFDSEHDMMRLFSINP